MIQVNNLRKAFATVTAVDGVSFDIRQGETFGLLGPNGAGKTTTINMLTGVLRPDSGEVSINDTSDPTRLEVRQHLGVAPQALALYEELTAEENVAFLAKLYGLSGPRLKERVAWALEFAGLTERRADRIRTFSGGMKRRLNLACALVHDPQVVFLDEPTVGVDPQSRNYIFSGIEALAKEGRTILYTTHYMEEAQRLCDRVAIMDHGRILALDTVENLIEQHGGQALVEAELEGDPPDGVQLPSPPENGILRFSSASPFEEAARLVAADVKFVSFRVERPNLEVVFLALTGRRLRD
jgi:ABC-2 type transport system ATP-binding protein